MEYYLAVKKKIVPFVTVWMDLENIVLSEISRSEKDKYYVISFTCGILWTNWTNKENWDRGLMGLGNSVVIAGGREL